MFSFEGLCTCHDESNECTSKGGRGARNKDSDHTVSASLNSNVVVPVVADDVCKVMGKMTPISDSLCTPEGC